MVDQFWQYIKKDHKVQGTISGKMRCIILLSSLKTVYITKLIICNVCVYVLFFAFSVFHQEDIKVRFFKAMDVKRCLAFMIVIFLIASSPTRGVDMDERRAAKNRRILKQLRGYLNLGRDTKLNDVAKYALSTIYAPNQIIWE